MIFSARKLWSDYFPDVNGIVYLVDAADRMRFPECKEQLLVLYLLGDVCHCPFIPVVNDIIVSLFVPGSPGRRATHGRAFLDFGK